MMNISVNKNYFSLEENYLFADISARVGEYKKCHPDEKIISLGIGDVTRPLTASVAEAMSNAVNEMRYEKTFRGYAPAYGYDFLRDAVSAYYESLGVNVKSDDIFLSDGAKSDIGNLPDILGSYCALIQNPSYPAYKDTCIMSGREVVFLKACRENGFLPAPDGVPEKPYVIYLCSPCNPTGAVYNRNLLEKWVSFALKTGSLIVYDAAYEAFITGTEPRSVFCIPGAEYCAAEICSLSKTSGFTGVRCSWTVISDGLMSSEGVSLKKLWQRRMSTRSNGVPYVVQRAAEAALSKTGRCESELNIRYYAENSRIISHMLEEKGVYFTGGKSSPYVWMKCPEYDDSRKFFDYLLSTARVVGTPGDGFGGGGAGYFRLSSFATRENTIEAVSRMSLVI